jgi:protein SCO1/2
MTVMAAEASVWRRRLAISATLAAVALLVAIVVYAFAAGGRDFVSVASVKIGGPFTLTTQSGTKLSDSDLKGEPFAVFFGFTHCPEVCPTTLWEMSEALKALGPDADKLKVLFISIDPTRDDPEALALYLQSFDPRIVGLTGSEEEIGTVAASYRAYWRKVPTGDGDYTMDHTASIYLMDADGEFTSTISYDEHADMRLAKLKKLLAGGVS